MIYNWQQKDWPHFQYSLTPVEDRLYEIAERMGRTNGMLMGVSNDLQSEALVDMMVSEAIKTSEIEGEYLSRIDVMSSIRNNLGLNNEVLPVRDRRAKGIAELMSAIRNKFSDDLSVEELFSWHSMLMKGDRIIKVGSWRDHEEPMQVISGPIGKEKVHYEAPPSSMVASEMDAFIAWFNKTEPHAENAIKQGAIRSAIAHLYFETIHPFEDGNGRIGRAISEKALSQGAGRPVLLSLSKIIEGNKRQYYDALKEAQRSNEITAWLEYFVDVVLQAQIYAEEQIGFILKKTKFFDRHKDKLNARQSLVLQKMLEAGVEGIDQRMTAKKYIKIAKTTKPTATRDLQDLVEKGAFMPQGEGRSRGYLIVLS